MKKKLFLMIAVLCCMLLLVATVAACEDKGDTGENPGGDVTENPGGENPGGENPGGDVTENPEPEVYYTVTFDTQGGSAVQSVQAKEGATIAAPASPTKDRYNFTGWYKNIACTEPWDFAVDTVNGNITLYAGWTGEDGKILAVENATISGMDILLPVRESVDSVSLANAVTIGGKGTWRLYRDILGVQEIPTKIATGASGRLLDGDNVFYIVATSSDAQQIWTYTLTVHRSYQAAISIKDPYGDVHNVDSAYTYFETYSPDYSFDGYTVNSWTSSDPVWSEKGYVTGETSFTPVCTPNKYTATLDTNNGSLPDGAENTVSVTYDQTYRFPVPSRKGYTFNGWELFGTSELITDNKGVSDGIWEWPSNKTVRANWTINSYSVAAVAEDDKYGTVKGAGNYNYDSYVTLEAVTNAGYVFIGWYDGDDVVGESEKLTFLMPDENLSYTAKWETDEAAKAFTFTSTPTSFTITAINDKNITSVVLPDYEGVSITIGENAYDGCTALTTLSLPENVVSIGGNAFRNCTGLTSVTIPDSVTSIGAGAFSGCSSLESITIPFVGAGTGNTSANGYQYPFGYIFGYASYTGGMGVEQYYYDSSSLSTRYGYFYIPSSLRSVTVTGGNILYGAFRNCSMLTSVTLGESVWSIGRYAFYNCAGLTSVTIGASVESIGDSAFWNCEGLSSVTIGNSVASIGEDAFWGCTGLTSVTIGNSVTSIGSSAFRYCYKLVEVYNKSSLDITAGSEDCGEVGYYAKNVYTEENGSWFTDTADGYRFLYDGTKGYLIGYYGEATDITLPGSFSAYDGTTVNSYEIYKYAFYKNTSLTSVTIPDSVTSIGSYAFWDCTGLTSVTIGSSVTSIGSEAFYGCYKLVEVYNKSSLDITAGSSGNGKVGYYAKNVYTEEDGSRFTDTADGYRFLYDGTKGYLVSYYGEATDITLPESFTAYDGTTVNSYEINRYAFYKNTSLTSVTIPDSVTSIGSYAFYNCTGLTSVTIGNSVESIGYSAFEDCTGLTSVTIPDSVTSIGDYAFRNCTGLASVTIGNSVTSIGSYAFSGCTAEIIWGENPEITAIGNYAFSGYKGDSIVIPDSVTSIGDYAFYNCTGLTSVTIPDSVTSIGDYAFRDCTGLTSVTIGNSVTSIGSAAFYNCTGLTSVTIGTSVKSIGIYAFSGCYKLVEVYNKSSLNITAGSSSYGDVGYYAKRVYTGENDSRFTDTSDGYRFLYYGAKGYLVSYYGEATDITLPESFTAYDGTNVNTYEINRYAFYGNTVLTSVTIPDSVTSIGSYAFYNCKGLTSVYYTGDIAGWCGISFGNEYANPLRYAGDLYIDGQSVTDLVIPDSVTEIKDYAFYGYTGLTSVTIPDSVESIGDYAFSGCTVLTSVTIPDSVTSIGYNAFVDCTGLTSVTIGNSVTSIGDSAFEDCTGLTSVTIPDSVTSIGWYAFKDCTGLTSVTIGSSVTSIRSEAFYGCYKLVEVYNKSSLNIKAGSTSYGYVGYYAKNVYTEENGSWFTDTADGYRFIYDGTKGYLVGYYGEATDITLPGSFSAYDGTTVNSYEIYKYAFYGLTSVVIPDSVTSIGEHAFYDCTGLNSVVFEDTEGWQVSWNSDFSSYTSLASADLADASTAANYFKSTYYYYYWRKV